MSSDKSVQANYYKCAAVCLHSARLYNPGLELVFFSNQELPVIDGVDYGQLFKVLNVRFYQTDFDYAPPPDYSDMWRNQFYEFSILRFVSNCPDFNDDDNLVLIDSDCVITGPVGEIFDKIKKHRSIAYALDYTENAPINGMSRNQMRPVFSALSGAQVDKAPVYYAGEFFGATVEMIKKYFSLFRELWPKLLALNAAGETTLPEEAYVFSFLFFISGNENNIANKYIKRLWTDPSSFRNIRPGDEALLIWHLPKHKVSGFPRLFRFLKGKSFSTAIPPGEYHDMIKELFTVPHLKLKSKLYFSIRKAAKKILAMNNPAGRPD